MSVKRITLFSLVVVLAAVLPACKGGGVTDPEPPPVNLSFSGTITSGGSPLAGVMVYLSRDGSKSTVTDANGAFSFTGLTGDQYVVTPSLRNTAFSPSNYELGATSRSDIDFTASPATPGASIGEIAADLTALDQTGQPVSLYSYFGKVILIDFSADWCSGCQAEAAKLESLYQTYRDRGFEVLTVLVEGSPAVWATLYGLSFPVLDDSSQALWGIYGDYYLPLNIVLDRNMTIRYKAPDFAEPLIVSAIEKYL
jgi:peroxiredoxin